MASTGLSDGYYACDYVVGRTLLSTYITLENVSQVEQNTEGSVLEAKVNQALERFDYRRALQSLKNECALPSEDVQHDFRKDFFQAFGFLHRTKPEEVYRPITENCIIPEIQDLDAPRPEAHAEILRSASRSNHRDEHSPPPYTYVGMESEQPTIELQVPDRSSVEVWRYTSRLWEEAQCCNELPEVHNEMIGGFPTRFRCAVKFRGRQGKGEASSKKQAKHIASKDVCEQLGIYL
ncbi:hypothetical protein BDW75DRAFT_247697 [Aspergillus navahoensis]